MAQPVLERLLQTYAPLGLCAQSYPSAVQQRSQAAAEEDSEVRAIYTIFVIALGLFGLGLFLVVITFVDSNPEYLLPGVILVVLGLVFAPLSYNRLKLENKEKNIRLHGIQATARVIEIKDRKGPTNNVVSMTFEVMVQVVGQSDYKATLSMTLNEKKAALIVPNAMISVRVDPTNPSYILIEAN